MPKHVLIAPLLGYRKDAEWERLRLAIEEAEATRVHLLTLPRDADTAREVREHARQELRAMEKSWKLFEWQEHTVNLLSFDASLEAFATVFALEKGNEITVSLGTGGAAGAVASTIACLLWGGRGVYVSSPGYEALPVESLPSWLSLGAPLDDDELRVLQIVLEESDGMDKKTIVDRLKAMGRIRKDQDKHAYRHLTSNLLPRLVKNGLVTVGPRDAWDRRHHFVRATTEGARAHRILSAMMRSPRETIHIRGQK